MILITIFLYKDAKGSKQLVNFFLADTTASEGGVAPERSLESPNRITRLIANRREKLMRMAAAEGLSASDSGSEGDNARRRSKSKTKSKGVKRKHSKLSGRRRPFVRRKCTVLKVNSDSDSEDEQPPVDAAQPSTSSGVISRRSRYVTSAIEKDGKRSSYSSSNNSSSSEDNNAPGKRNHSKTDSDASVKAHKQKHRKCKNSSRHPDGHSGKSQSKRRKLDDRSGDEGKTVDSKNCANGSSTSKDRSSREDRASTPSNKWLQIPCTPDSGIKSGVSSTGGKNSETTRKERRDGGTGDSSDHEQKLKNLECFRKKVEELARRSYRSAFKPQARSTTSDSSD